MIKKIFISILFIFTLQFVNAQQVQILTSVSKTSFRGLSVVSDNIVWVSGSNGKVGKSEDGGTNWKWMNVVGYEKIDFRDIEAFDKNTAIIMGISSPAYILKTTNGGVTWNKVYENKDTSMFLDAMSFSNEKNGLVIGDPINNKVFMATTNDGGNTWQSVNQNKNLTTVKGEAFFASSGTNICNINKNSFALVSGGMQSHLFIKNKIILLPFNQATETSGANSIAYNYNKKFIVVGGDFNAKDSINKNCFITNNYGKTFTTPTTQPHGYRSCVLFFK